MIITEEEAEDGSGIVTTLRIAKVSDQDAGKYSLLVKNNAGEVQMGRTEWTDGRMGFHCIFGRAFEGFWR